MSSASLRSSMEEPKYNFNLIRSIATVMLGAACYGVDVQIAGAVAGYDSFIEEWCVDRFGNETTCYGDPGLDNERWQNGFLYNNAFLTLYSGMAIGALLAGPSVSNSCGRRACVSLGGVLTAVGAACSSYAHFGSVAAYYVFRFVTGFGVGTCCFAIPLYNSEISTPNIRGTTGGLYQVSVGIGQFIASKALAELTDWRIGVVLPGIVGLVVAMLVWTVPESPRWVMRTKGYDAALVILKQVRAGDPTQEAKMMEQTMFEERHLPKTTYGDLWTNKSLRRRVLVACYLSIAQQFTAINVYLGLWTTVSGHLHIDNANAFMANWLVPLINLGNITSIFLLDSSFAGRKSLLLVSSLLQLPTQIITGISSVVGWGSIVNKVALAAYSYVWMLAWGTVVWVLPSELFTMSERGPALGVSTFVQFAFNLAVGKPSAFLMAKNFSVFLFILCGLQVTNIIWVIVAVKETKGVPLEDVPALYDGKQRVGSRIFE